MSLVALVSLVAFGYVAFNTQLNLRSGIDSALTAALDNTFSRDNLPFLGRDESRDNDLPSGFMSAYTVTVTWDGKIYADSDLLVQMDEDTLSSAVESVLEKASTDSNSQQGRIGEYNLYYKASVRNSGYRIAFVDSSSYDKSVHRMYFSLFATWFALMCALLAVTIFLSRYVTRPIAAAWENQQRFIADASHELKTPLTVILADASILAQNPEKTAAEQQMWIEGISSEAERMKRLTEDMLTLAQADAGQEIKPVLGDVDLSRMVGLAVLQFEPAAFERGLLIEEDIDDGIRVQGAPDKLEGLLKTLLENACKYGSGSDSPITVSLKRDRNSAVLSVGNGGPGISPEDLPHVFERFYKSDKSRTQTGESASFGLGLSIAKSTAELHKGTISVASANEHTEFTVTLPLAKQ